MLTLGKIRVGGGGGGGGKEVGMWELKKVPQVQVCPKTIAHDCSHSNILKEKRLKSAKKP